jgi:hypothetical protein
MKGLVVASVLSVFAAVVLDAQGNLGGLTGNVTDQTGAPVTEVRLSLRNVETNTTLSTTSSEGIYAFRAIPPGQYMLEAEKDGFKKVVQGPLTILTATTSNLDLTLTLGAVTESVTVSGEAVAIQTTSPEIGTVMTRKTLLDLPIQVGGSAATTAASGRRQPETFIFLTPGVVGIPWSKNINGNPGFTQEILIDGVTAQLGDTAGFLAQTSPPYEAIEEFKVQNTLFPAEYGRGLGIINYTLRSGSNQYHGGLFEFLRNDKLDARPFFARTRPVVRFNEYGGNFGGPVWIPKVYNGRDKTFFNFNYTGLRNSPPIPGNLVSVPTPAFKRGDFSGFTDSAGNLIPIYDPATTQPDGSRTPFPGNIIPENRISGVARNTLALMPDPDLPGYFNNYIARNANPVEDDIWSLKVDQIITSSHRLSYSVWRSLNDQYVNSVLGASAGPLGPWFLSTTKGNNHRVNYDHTVRPTLLHHFAFGYTFSGPTRKRDDRTGNELIKLPGVPENAPGFPTFVVGNNYGSLEIGNSVQQPVDPVEKRTFGIVDNWTWIKGRHQFKGGVDIRFYHFNEFDGATDGGISGRFDFSPLNTSNLTATNSASLGNGWASFLLGHAFTGTRLIPADQRGMRTEYYAWYVEDVFKATSRLTVTLGLRHEIPTVMHEIQNRNSLLDLHAPNPEAGGRPGVLRFLGPGERLTDTYYRAFSPRVGVAYMITPRTVLRSGFGIFYSPTNATNIGRANRFFRHGYSFQQSFPQLTSGREPALLLDQGLPPFTGTLPDTDPTQVNSLSIDYMNPGAGKPGYAASWTLDVQRELPGQVLLDAAYVGQRGVALPSGLENLNQVPSEYLRLGNLLNADINSEAARNAGIPIPYPGFRGSVGQALRSYPQYTNINNYFQPTGWSTYHALQVRVQKRYAAGLSFQVAYTLSKTLVSGPGYTGFGDDAANARPLDTANREIEKRLAPFDAPHNLIFTWGYELPFGRGKPVLGSAGGLVNALVGGWQVNAIHRYVSGTPIGVGGGPVIPLFNGGNRPDRVPGSRARSDVPAGEFDPAVHVYLNLDAFSQPASFTFGNAAPTYEDMRTFAFLNEDLSVLKSIPIVEQHRLEFRAEFFNVLNRVVFGGPNANVNTPAAFGRIGGQANSPRSIQFGLKYIF